MKHPLETLTTAAGILLMAFLSCLLLPAPALGLTLAQKLVTTFHLMDLSQLYTLLFCLWFLVLALLSILFCALSGDAGSRWRIKRRLSPYFAAYFAYSPSPKGTFMDKQSLHETAKRRNAWPLSYPLSSFAGLLARSSMFLKLAARFLCCRRSYAASPLSI